MSDLRAPIESMVEQLRQIAAKGSLCLDSRQIVAGDVFLACPGQEVDGRDFIEQAIARGAVGVVHEKGLSQAQQKMLGSVPAWSVDDLRSSLGALSSSWWGNPSSALTIIAITGTNGKTTTAHWLAAALRTRGIHCGAIGTLGITDVNGQLREGLLTTPDVVSLHRCLALLLSKGATHVVMEASSIGLDQGRLDAVQIDVGVFTNLTQDHLDYHRDMASYAQAKALLFKWPSLKHAVINVDDPYSSVMRQACSAQIWTYSIANQQADLSALNPTQAPKGQQFDLAEGDQLLTVRTPFVGAHMIANMLAVAGVLRTLGWTMEQVGEALHQLPPVPGRLEPVDPIAPHGKGALPTVFVDYAHTPDALANILRALRPLAQAQGARLWCVVGCGGNRDLSKRPLMARVASEHADRVVFTSDNPRHEDPQAILRDMTQGIVMSERVSVQPDRAIAILQAIWQANGSDIVVLAGKGHEKYQDVAGQKLSFDDRQWARLGLLMASAPLSVQTDSRQLTQGALFVALRGERFDGHDYLASAQKAGAIAAIVERADVAVELPQIVLGDTLKALQTLAMAWRSHFNLPVIGITGSNGKTTTKEMTAAICRAWVGEHDTLSTTGNLNNDIGVPLTVMRLRAHHRAAVIEMGMNHPGEIALLALIAQPTVVLVLNAQREHQEFMRTVDAVALENGQALRALPVNGVAVYPANDTYSALWANLSAHVQKHQTFGYGSESTLQITDCKLDALGSEFTLEVGQDRAVVKLPVAGVHNVMNATAATACALAAGAPLSTAANALSGFVAVKGRLQVHRLSDGRTLVDDTYNANPDSVRAAIDVLASLNRPCALVLGDMGEVGENGAQMHAEVGRYAQEKSIDYLWGLGEATQDSVKAFGIHGRWFKTPEALCEHARSVNPVSVLVKGSRFMAMERVVDQWLSHCAATRGQGARHAG